MVFKRNREFNSNRCTIGKVWKRLFKDSCNTCSTCAKTQHKSPANPKGTLQRYHHNQWNSLPWTWSENFTSPSSKGNRYVLTAVCMLTGFTFCIPIKSKKAEDVMKAYTDNICCVFGPSKKILTDNGTEFKNKMWTDVFKRMHREHRTSPIYSTQCNGRIKGFHKFFKGTIGKQLQKGLELDNVIFKATSAYNFFSNTIIKGSTFLPYVWPTSSSKSICC